MLCSPDSWQPQHQNELDMYVLDHISQDLANDIVYPGLEPRSHLSICRLPDLSGYSQSLED